MNFYIVIPAHNEQDFIHLTLNSLVSQTLQPKRLVIVNDNSTDNTEGIVNSYIENHNWISIVNSASSKKHIPGAKIVNAFYKGFDTLDDDYDIICKFDADLIFPDNYLETLAYHFKSNQKLGMAAGFCYIKKNKKWVIEGLTNTDHIRGGLKAYTKTCFAQIGQLKPSMGWDTIDELLAKYYSFELLTDHSLQVKHLKPTGKNYNRNASKHLQGEAFYKMRLGFILSFLAALKLAFKKKSLLLFIDYNLGYLNALITKTKPIVTKSQGRFIRQLRWKGIFKKVFKS